MTSFPDLPLGGPDHLTKVNEYCKWYSSDPLDRFTPIGTKVIDMTEFVYNKEKFSYFRKCSRFEDSYLPKEFLSSSEVKRVVKEISARFITDKCTKKDFFGTYNPEAEYAFSMFNYYIKRLEDPMGSNKSYIKKYSEERLNSLKFYYYLCRTLWYAVGYYNFYKLHYKKNSLVCIKTVIKNNLLFGFDYCDYVKDVFYYNFNIQSNICQNEELDAQVLELNSKPYAHYEGDEGYDEIFHYRWLIPFATDMSTDIEDYALTKPDPLEEQFSNYFRKVNTNIVYKLKPVKEKTDFQVVKELEREASCLDVQGNNTKVATVLKTVSLEELKADSPWLFKRICIYKNPAEFRDGLNTTIQNKFRLKKISMELQEILDQLPESAMGKKINIKKLGKEHLFLESDIRKDGWTTHHDLIKLTVGLLRGKVPDKSLDDILSFIENITIIGYKGEILKIQRGFGIGMLNQLATLMKIFVLNAAGYKKFLVNNDDIIIRTNRQYSDDFNHSKDDLVLKERNFLLEFLARCGYIPYKKKTIIGKCLRFCEEYITVGLSKSWDKNMILYNVLFKTTMCINIIMSKDMFNSLIKTYTYKLDQSAIYYVRKLNLKLHKHETPYESELPEFLGGYALPRPNNLDWTIRDMFEASPSIVGFTHAIRDRLDEFNSSFLPLEKKKGSLFENYYLNYKFDDPELITALESLDINSVKKGFYTSLENLTNPARSSNLANFYKRKLSHRRGIFKKYLIERYSVPDYFYQEICHALSFKGKVYALHPKMFEEFRLTEVFKALGKYVTYGDPNKYKSEETYTRVPSLLKYLNLDFEAHQDRYDFEGYLNFINPNTFTYWQDDDYIYEVPIVFNEIAGIWQYSICPLASYHEFVTYLKGRPTKLELKPGYKIMYEYPWVELNKRVRENLPNVQLKLIGKERISIHSNLYKKTMEFCDSVFIEEIIMGIDERLPINIIQSILSKAQWIERLLKEGKPKEEHPEYEYLFNIPEFKDLNYINEDWDTDFRVSVPSTLIINEEEEKFVQPITFGEGAIVLNTGAYDKFPDFEDEGEEYVEEEFVLPPDQEEDYLFLDE
jgi:hypothetical protein